MRQQQQEKDGKFDKTRGIPPVGAEASLNLEAQHSWRRCFQPEV
jgi:hypothetical protein